MQNIAIWIIAALAVGGGGYYVYTQSSGSASVEQEVPKTYSGSMRSLLALGHDLTCTFSRVEGDATMSGTLYVADGGERLRTDFSSTQQGQTISGSSIVLGTEAYTWGESPMGTMAVKSTVYTGETGMAEGAYDFYSESLDFKCEKWRVDESKFDLPADIEFREVETPSANLDASGSVEASGSLQGNQCASCDMIPDASARAQCLAALSC